jgi:peptidoglycan/LPS O-acetylase OafA/YrhL
MARDSKRLYVLDLLRFVAAIAVMLHHQVGAIAGWGVANHHNMPVLAPITHFGLLGVDLFFLISGFVILMSTWGKSVGDFAVSRFVRIFPAYWFAVTVAILIFLIWGVALGRGPGSEGHLRSYLPNMTMLEYGTGSQPLEVVYWTLWYELHFYALIALLVWRGITYRSCVIFMGVWLLAGTFSQEANFTLLNDLLFPVWAPYFIAGMAFYLVYRYGPNLVLGMIIAFSWALCVYYRCKLVDRQLVWPTVWDTTVTIVVTLLFLVMWLVATRRMGWIRWRGAVWLGALTYPLYLISETISRPVEVWLMPRHSRWAVLGACMVASLAAAFVIHRFVERPVQAWLRPRLKRAIQQIRDADRGSLPAEPKPLDEDLVSSGTGQGLPAD